MFLFVFQSTLFQRIIHNDTFLYEALPVGSLLSSRAMQSCVRLGIRSHIAVPAVTIKLNRREFEHFTNACYNITPTIVHIVCGFIVN